MAEVIRIYPELEHKNNTQRRLYEVGELVLGPDRAARKAPNRVRCYGAGTLVASVVMSVAGLVGIATFADSEPPSEPTYERQEVGEDGTITVQPNHGAEIIFETYADEDDGPRLELISQIQEQGVGDNSMLMAGQKVVLPEELRD